MKIGLLSDTHSHLDKRVFDYFATCDEIWHGGDIGTSDIITQLSAFKKFRAVYGNIDDKEIQQMLPEDLRLEIEGLNVWITHIGGVPPNYNPRVKKLLKADTPDIFICGHSHILRVKKDPQFNNMLYINPGAAGNHGFHAIKTIMRFDIEANEVKNMEVIELGKRGAIQNE